MPTGNFTQQQRHVCEHSPGNDLQQLHRGIPKYKFVANCGTTLRSEPGPEQLQRARFGNPAGRNGVTKDTSRPRVCLRTGPWWTAMRGAYSSIRERGTFTGTTEKRIRSLLTPLN